MSAEVDPDGPEWVPTQEAAARLGVKVATLYAYVSRGLLTSRRVEGRRGSVFHRDDIERMAARGGVRPAAPDLVVQSALTELRDGVLRYRGRDVAELVGASRFEEVAALLWSGRLQHVGDWEAHGVAAAAARAALTALPAGTRPLDRLRVVCSVAAAVDPLGGTQHASGIQAAGPVIISTLIDALPAQRPGPARADVAGRLWQRLSDRPPDAEAVALLDAALVLLADHELAASTMSARVAASAGCDPWAVVECGLATVSGTLHGRSSLAVERLLGDGDGADVQVRVAELLRERGEIPGFGHPVHRSQDPRAVLLLDRLRDHVAGEAIARVDVLRAAAARRGIGPPNVDLALAAVTTALGLPVGSAEAVFGIARTAGWLAHALEQYSDGQLIRPRARYVGQPPPREEDVT